MNVFKVGMVMGRVWSSSSQFQTHLFLIDLDSNSNSKGLKFLDSPNLIGLESLMDLKTRFLFFILFFF